MVLCVLKISLHSALSVLLLSAFMGLTATARHVSKEMNDSVTSIQCMEAVPMIGDVPHPTNCYKFYSCVPSPPGSALPTMPIERICSSGDNGPLFYDFRSCMCNYDNSVCYDGIANRADFFTCAREYNASELIAVQPLST